METIKEPVKQFEKRYDLTCRRCEAVMRCGDSELGHETMGGQVNLSVRSMRCPHCTYKSHFDLDTLEKCEYIEPII